MYPYYLKKIESNKTTDQNFYLVAGPKIFYHINLSNNGECSMSKVLIEIKSHSTRLEFESRQHFIKISESEFNEKQSMIVQKLGLEGGVGGDKLAASKLLLNKIVSKLIKMQEVMHLNLKELNSESIVLAKEVEKFMK